MPAQPSPDTLALRDTIIRDFEKLAQTDPDPERRVGFVKSAKEWRDATPPQHQAPPAELRDAVLRLPDLELDELVAAAFGRDVDVRVPLLPALGSGPTRAEVRVGLARLVVLASAAGVSFEATDAALSGSLDDLRTRVETLTVLSTVADLLHLALGLPHAAARAALTSAIATEYVDADPLRDLVTASIVDAEALDLDDDQLERFIDLACSVRELRRAAVDRVAQATLDAAAKGGVA